MIQKSYNWSNPQSLNRYAYAGRNPLRATDPSGLDPCYGFQNMYVSYPPLAVLGATSVAVDCGLQAFDSVAVFGGSEGSAGIASTVSDLAGGFGVLAGGAALFYDLGESAGWWGGSPFHGNVAASQNGKSVPSMESVSAPGPAVDGMADNPMAQALFHGAGQPYWGAAYKTVEYASAYDAIAAAPVALDAVASLPTMNIAVGTVDGNLHFAYGAEGAWYHVVGVGADAFQTSAYAAQFADSAYTFSVPVLSTEGVAPELGEGAANCFTAVCGGFLRGWWIW